ncbi:MAG: 4Fe-4S binding protein, partial [Desulfatiglandales bacterium]
MKIWIDQTLCSGCKRCLKACPYDAVEMLEGKAVITERCVLCATCVEVCKEKAILSDIPPRTIPDFSDWKGIWVFVEHLEGKPLRVGLELLGKAQDLKKDLEQEVAAVVLGHEIRKLGEELLEYGAE